jgi:hypothetical protein
MNIMNLFHVVNLGMNHDLIMQSIHDSPFDTEFQYSP